MDLDVNQLGWLVSYSECFHKLATEADDGGDVALSSFVGVCSSLDFNICTASSSQGLDSL